MRVQVDRFMQAYTASLDKLSYQERLIGLRAITLAVGRIASLERIRAASNQNLDDDDEFMQAFDSMPDEKLIEILHHPEEFTDHTHSP